MKDLIPVVSSFHAMQAIHQSGGSGGLVRHHQNVIAKSSAMPRPNRRLMGSCAPV
ncbi:hypothetical protein [Lacticaseibacillus manihotivorans]|uniref:hypothetical protein n=1 Tax=Lacticaseibacillus manihotivorans TaxID=88233 RepID=UPI001FB36E60|nr:hypothetical protein [Lacticaseibacillus manihotivorans]